MKRIPWIDGLRGIADLIIAFNHFFNVDIPTPFRTFWDSPPSANRRLIQLPPFRIPFMMDPMVPLFMVISGYSISYTLLQTRNNNPDQFAARLRSSICRRPFRLFLPMFIFAIPSHLLFYFDLYSSNPGFPENITTRIHPGVRPWDHLCYMLGYFADQLSPLQLQWNGGLNGQLWTMPLEFRGSLVVYGLIYVQASWRRSARFYALGVFLALVLWFGHWDIVSFVAGLGLAELYLEDESNPSSPRSSPWTTLSYILRITATLYLFCLSSETEYPPGYRFLHTFHTLHWGRYGGWTEVRKIWHAIGAVLFFSVVLQSPQLQRGLSTRVAQGLGRLSFAVYLVHLLIYRVWRAPLVGGFWRLWAKTEYPGAEKAAAASLGWFLTAYALAGLVLGVVVMVMAEGWVRVVEPWCVWIAKGVERRLEDADADSKERFE
ncbi:hypothetical protein FE257_007377 [Aspergillus nanangensis]|uniref:Acyltransferase 3 domain-containing protein n=1 Tax=Aspergillus nanangensis TaxID=2582783 RepID=A0AAD4CMW6_ASPNN|nr:hypothetical protein FE257_007377 [Aspergillus nanangensis]